MSKRKATKVGSKGRDAEFENRQDMLNLNATLREVLQVPKEELERREAEWKADRETQQNNRNN